VVDFWADWCGEAETMQCIKETFEKKGYLLDTHTAVAAGVYEKYKKTGDKTKAVIVSTASPYKFPEDVLRSLGEDVTGLGVFDIAQRLSEVSKTPVPRQISALKAKPVRHTRVVEKDELKKAVLEVI